MAIGPWAVPTDTLLFGLIFVIALGAAALNARGQARAACGALFDILLAGLVAARVGFVALYFDQYQGDWLAMLDVRDRGFSLLIGGIAALLFAVFLAFRRTELRRPLSAAMIAAAFSTTLALALTHNWAGEGRQVPPVTVTRLSDGAAVKLADYGQGKPRVINLWASWCPPCRREMPLLERARHAHPGIVFLLVNQGESGDTVRAFLDRESLSHESILLDPFRDLSHHAGNAGLPTTLFFDADGQLVDTHLGGLSAATLHRYLQKLTVSASPLSFSTDQQGVPHDSRRP